MGTLQGKTYNEIVAVVGGENAKSSTIGENGKTIKIRQWMSAGYHITLLFDENDNCLGVNSEIRV